MNSWTKDAIFYHIYPLGFCGAPQSNNIYSQPINRIKKVEEWIPHIKSIGCNAIYLGPLFQSSTHGYDTADYYHVDSRLGSDDDFKALCENLHSNGIRIVPDGVFNHVGREFWAFRDVLEHGQASKYCSWFSNLRFDYRSPMGDNFTYDCWEGHYNLVKLNLKNPEVKQHLLGAVGYWIDNFNIDGLRLDAADCVDMYFLKELAAFCKNKKNDFWLMGEIIHGDYRRWANAETLDSVTNYECYKGLYSSHNEKNYFEIAYSLNRQFGDGGIYKNLDLYNFVDNHDVNRLASTVRNAAYLYPIHAMLFTMPGLPSIYYGSEWGILGQKQNNSDAPLRPALDLNTAANTSPNKDLSSTIALLAKIRKESNALKYGNYKQIIVKNEQFVFARITDNETIIAAFNLSENEASISFNVPGNFNCLVDLLNNNEQFVRNNNMVNLNIPSCWARILKVE